MDTTTETQELYKGFERSNDFMKAATDAEPQMIKDRSL